MYVRLAFAVAAHLEPEILLVDEVLAVGDIAFQKKCLGKMRNVAKEGRTVLFISHNLQAISQLCSRTILLNEGRLLEDGETQEVLNTYTATALSANSLDGDLSSPKLRASISSNPASRFKWTDIMVINSQKQPTSEIRFGEPFEVIFRGHANKTCENVIIGFAIISKVLGPIFSTHQFYNGLSDTLPEGISEFHVKMDPNILAPGFYEIHIAAEGPGVADYIPVSMEFNVLDFGITPDKSWHAPHQVGVVDYPCKWSVKFLSRN
jgi:lipopolysaccharide transport system ATP-binding protein